MLFQTHEALVADDDVVDEFDVEDATGLHKLLCRLDIVLRRGRITAGMVVAEDQAGQLRMMAGRKSRRRAGPNC